MSSRSEQLGEDGEAPARGARPGSAGERAEDERAWGPAERLGAARLPSVQGSRGWQGPGLAGGGSLADSHVALWQVGGGEDRPSDGLCSLGSQAKAGQSWENKPDGWEPCVFICKAREWAAAGRWGEEGARDGIPTLGACQLLGQEAPPCKGASSRPRCVGGGGHGKRGKKLGSPGASWWAGSSLPLSGGSSSWGWGWERRCLCVRSYSSLEAWQRSEGFTGVGGENGGGLGPRGAYRGL